MKNKLLLGYQILTGLSDTFTGLLLVFAPAFTLHLMQVKAPKDALVYLSYIGAFVLSTGVACLYGASLITPAHISEKLEAVWLLTAITRGLVALFVLSRIFNGSLEPAWASVAASDGFFSLLQLFGLAKGWLRSAGGDDANR
jgi:hypothetical protein